MDLWECWVKYRAHLINVVCKVIFVQNQTSANVELILSSKTSLRDTDAESSAPSQTSLSTFQVAEKDFKIEITLLILPNTIYIVVLSQLY